MRIRKILWGDLMKRSLLAVVVAVTLVVTGCGISTNSPGNTSSSSDSGNSNDNTSILDDLVTADSANVSMVKGGNVGACSTATLGEMADAFLDSPDWSEFTSDTGKTVVELKGGITNDGLPAEALFQFVVTGNTFSTNYLSIDGQNMLVISGLLTKMCNAV